MILTCDIELDVPGGDPSGSDGVPGLAVEAGGEVGLLCSDVQPGQTLPISTSRKEKGGHLVTMAL